MGNYVSVSSTLDSAVWPYWLKLFVPGPAGDSEKPGWAVARARAQRRPGQMGQQMGKEAEPPLICSTENPESGHTQKREEDGGRQKEKYRHWDVQYRYEKADNKRGWPQCWYSYFIQSPPLFTVTPYRAANKRFRVNLCLATWSNNLFTSAKEKKYFFKKHILITGGWIKDG